MRSNGVPNFPDPDASGGFQLGGGIDPASPAFKAAQAKCQKLLPAGPGSGPAPSAQALAHWVKVAQCMRRHGISGFPDPMVSDRDGVIFVFPRTLDMESPMFTQAAAACGFHLHNH
jgi:hypothetical protein